MTYRLTEILIGITEITIENVEMNRRITNKLTEMAEKMN